MGVIGKFHNGEYLIYIFTGNVENSNPIIFNNNKSSWYKELRTNFSPILINTSDKNVHFLIKLMGEIPVVV